MAAHLMRRGLRATLQFVLAAVVAALLPLVPVHSAHAAGRTIVSLTFDDGLTQSPVRAILLRYGMKGTFYVNANLIGTGGDYLSRAELDALFADGHEIGGHTTNHVNLATLSDAAQRTAICGDLQTLNGWYPGQIHSFAYPFASTGPTTQAIVAEGCPGVGSYSARTVGGLASGSQCSGCAAAESIPPGNPYYINTPESILSTTTLDEMKTLVTQAEASGGGWVPLVFHRVCDGCSSYAVSAATLDAFLAWLKARESNHTYVRTVYQVMSGDLPPPPPPPPLGPNLLLNASLETDQDGNGQADCWLRNAWGTQSATWTRPSDAQSGSRSERVQITSYSSGDVKLLPTLDAGQAAGGCAPPVEPGAAYVLGAWYKATTPVVPVLFYRDAGGVWRYWRDGPLLPATASWSQLTYNPGAIPAGASALSFGIALDAVGTLTTDSYSLQRVLQGSPDTTPPTVALSAPAAGATVSGAAVTVSATATDNVGVVGVQFRLDGVNLGAEDTTAPYSVTWNTTTASNGTHTLTAVARDAAGNVATSAARTVTVNNQAVQNLVVNPSLEADSNGDGTPDCWLRGGYGTNTVVWSRVTGAHGGTYANSLQMTARTSGDAKLVQAQDAGACASAAVPGARYTASAWYKSTVSTAFVLFYRSSAGVWTYWTTSPAVASAADWAQASFTTPALPAGATHISFGLALSAVGTLVTDDYALIRAP
jgi:hypothetical protein